MLNLLLVLCAVAFAAFLVLVAVAIRSLSDVNPDESDIAAEIYQFPEPHIVRHGDKARKEDPDEELMDAVTARVIATGNVVRATRQADNTIKIMEFPDD